MTRPFRDGHTGTWYAADASLGWWGPDGARRLRGGHRRPGHPAGEGHLVPGHQPAPARRPREQDSPWPAARLAEIVRIYGIRHWIEQGYKQVKDELGWADFQVRSDVAIRRHQALVNCAFSFCWVAGLTPTRASAGSPQRRGTATQPQQPRKYQERASTQLAPRAARRPQLADPRDHAHALVAGLVQSAPAR